MTLIQTTNHWHCTATLRRHGCVRRHRQTDESTEELPVTARAERSYVDEEKPVIDSRDEVKHSILKRALLGSEMMWIDERVRPEMKSECCEEAEWR